MEVLRYARKQIPVVLIGHAGHPEVEGTMGQLVANDASQIVLVETEQDVQTLPFPKETALAYVSQTTLSVDETRGIIAALKAHYPNAIGPKADDICYATQNRQDAVRLLAKESECVLVIGSPNSSNSNRLRELSEILGTPAYLLDCPSQLKAEWFTGKCRIGMTAGASAPETLVQSVIKALDNYFDSVQVETLAGIEETVTFNLPPVLRVPTKVVTEETVVPA